MAGEKSRWQSGFTLIEILIATTISMVVIGGMFSLYTSHLKTRTVQNSMLDMQQNLRAAMYLMGRDIRMAGYQGDVTGASIAGITVANATAFSFTYLAETDGDNNDDDDDTDEYDELSRIGYALYDADSDLLHEEIGRTQDSVTGVVAEAIEGIDFLYILNDETKTRIPANLQLIKAVQVTILAKSSRPDNSFESARSYECDEASDSTKTVWGPFNDVYHRKLLTGTFLLRNMGI